MTCRRAGELLRGLHQAVGAYAAAVVPNELGTSTAHRGLPRCLAASL